MEEEVDHMEAIGWNLAAMSKADECNRKVSDELLGLLSWHVIQLGEERPQIDCLCG
jgi:hypothetical protein